MAEKKLVIIDGYSLLFRAFYGTRFLSTSDGRPTNALFGLTSMLFNLIEAQRPDAIIVALDAPGKTFRHAEYAEYKGTRRETPEELVVQFPVARDLIACLGIPTIELTGFEADDVVGTVSREAEENGYRSFIITGDLDQLQLVDHCVSVLTTRTGVTDVVTYTPEGVRERYGFGPEYITDYKALVGDPSDNIPGVPGVGEKTASYLIQKFGHVEEMLERFDEVEEKYRKKIEPNIEQMKKSKWLATIDRHAPFQYDFKPYQLSPDQLDRARAFMESLEFRSHAKKIEQVLGRYVDGFDSLAVAAPILTESFEFKSEGTAKSLQELLDWVEEKEYALVFSVQPAQRSMFDEDPLREACIALGDKTMRAPAALALELFAKSPSKASMHDAKPLYKLIPPTLVAPGSDTMLAGYVLQSGRSSYAFRDLVQGYLDTPPPESLEGQAVALYRLSGVLNDRIKQEGQTRVLDEIELPLVPILAEMEQAGIAVNRGFLEDFSRSLSTSIEQTAGRVFELAGQEFLIASPKQLGEVLFDKLGIPGAKKTKTGYATGAEVLQELVLKYPIAGEVLNWRELTKLKSTYADALPKMIGDDGRIHTTFNQTVAATGRLSSNDPNLQNIPIRTELGREIRKAFVAAPGYSLGSFDYSQIELRLLAHYCKDEALIEAFTKRIDVHSVTAGLMFGCKPDEVSKQQRRLAKMLNYAVLYGVTDYGLAAQLGEGFSVSEAKALIQQYFERFPKVKAFTESVIVEARSKGYTVTMCGRRRYFPEIHAANRAERLYSERQAVNAPLQGTAADMVKLAMIRVRKAIGESKTRMLLQVHDELVFEMVEQEAALIEPIRSEMEHALDIDVPIEVDAKIGSNWSEMKEASRA